MVRKFVIHMASAALLVCFGLAPAFASDVSGKIVVQKDIGKVAAVAVTYDLRGAAVRDLPPGKVGNSFERVAIWLESENPESGDRSAAPITATMQQRNRQLEPELLVIPIGSTVNFPNLDPIFHNIFSLSKAKSFDLGYYPKGQSRSVVFSRSGIVQVYCHVHPNMSAAIVVSSSRWFGTPAADGTFLWSGVPAGPYRLMIWQRFAGLFRRDLQVPESGQVSIRATIPEDRESH